MTVQLVESLLSLAFPVVCEICGGPVSVYPATGVCRVCESGIPLIPGPHCARCGRHLKTEAPCCSECWGKSFHFDNAFACVPYEGKIKELLHAYKFHGRKYLKHFFLKIMQKFITAYMSDLEFDAVVAVPLDPIQKRARGFNQSEILSSKIGGHLSIPDLSRFLRRARTSQPQHRMTKSGRKQNVRGCFETTEQGVFQSKKILLIDDILTTGQTASEAARVIKEDGAVFVTALACARGI